MATERPKRGVPEGLWIRCPQCKATVFKKEVEVPSARLPRVRSPLHLPARDRIAQLLDERQLRGMVRRPAAVRPARVRGSHPVPSAARWKSSRRPGMPDAAVVGQGVHSRPAGRARHHRLRVHGRQHGLGRRREADARRGTRDRTATAADLRQRLRRRGADAGRHPVADADGEGLRGARPLRLGRRALRLAS